MRHTRVRLNRMKAIARGFLSTRRSTRSLECCRQIAFVQSSNILSSCHLALVLAIRGL
ncbi:MAG: hypothetical protein V7K38_01975 [Nostoc sp.]|uniref:hypothetical protein n=1 Tax=Nostoc sp. TaxID=1180 RepID=UPI002FF9DEBA